MTKLDNSHPLVTVYMPTYNRVELLQRAVQSVLSQDYKNIELIIVDDGSTDGTHEYLAEMAEKHSCFKYFINEKNSGACFSRNKAIFAANGEFITGLDDDDYFESYHISNYLKYWSTIDSDCIAIYSNAYLLTNYKKNKVKRPKYCKQEDLLSGNWIGNQLFTRTLYLQRIGGFDINLPAWQDLECWYRLLSFYKKRAELCPSYSYIVDKSHPHERISSKKLDNIFVAYKYFCEKHNISSTEKSILNSQLYIYCGRNLKLANVIRGVVYPIRNGNIDRKKAYIKRMIKLSIINNLSKFK